MLWLSCRIPPGPATDWSERNVRKDMHANDGSAPAFKAFELALALAKQNGSELHLVSVMEIDYMPEFVEDIRQETGTAARRFRSVLQRAHALAERSEVSLLTHVLTGHPVRDIVKLAADVEADLLVIGGTGHS